MKIFAVMLGLASCALFIAAVFPNRVRKLMTRETGALGGNALGSVLEAGSELGPARARVVYLLVGMLFAAAAAWAS